MTLFKNIHSQIVYLCESLRLLSLRLSIRSVHKTFTCTLLFMCVAILNLGAAEANETLRIAPSLPYSPYETELQVTITSPANEETVEGILNVDVSVTDNINVDYVELYVDSQYLGSMGNAPYVFFYNTSQLTNGIHEFSVIAYDYFGNTAENRINVLVNNETIFSSIYLNAGGGQVVSQGITWQEDRGPLDNSRVASRDLKLADSVYNSERYGDFSYRFKVPNGFYGVKLKFAELFFTRKNQRVFNVAINGIPLVTDLDLVKVAGFATPYDLIFSVNVSDGVIKIDFTSTVHLAKVNAIEITKY